MAEKKIKAYQKTLVMGHQYYGFEFNFGLAYEPQKIDIVTVMNNKQMTRTVDYSVIIKKSQIPY